MGVWRKAKRFAQSAQGMMMLDHRQVTKVAQCLLRDYHSVPRKRASKMVSLIAGLMLTVSSLAIAPPCSPAKSGPICFTPPDLHPVSDVIQICSSLLSDFVDLYKPEGSVLRWTSNHSEIGADVVYLPRNEYLVNKNRTQACLLEILDSAGTGDSYPATQIQKSGEVILDDCFRANKCGIIPLPPGYTTSLAVCGSRHKPNNTLYRGSRPAPGDAVIIL